MKVHNHRAESVIRRIEYKFPHQFYYGAREVYIETLKLPSNLYIIGVLQHWASFFPNTSLRSLPTPRSESLKRSFLYVNSSLEERAIKDSGFKKVRSIGSPVSYLLRSDLVNIEGIKEINKLLFFPEHYGGQNPLHYNEDIIEGIMQNLFNVFPEMKITICVYWNDLLDSNWYKLAKRFDIEVVCAGLSLCNPHRLQSPSRTQFYCNLIEIIRQHQYIVAEGHTSALVYAAAMGKPIRVLENSIPKRVRSRTTDDWQLMMSHKELYKDFVQTDTLRETAREAIGYYSCLNSEHWLKHVKHKLL